jgi:hypothetical protein
MDYLPSMHHSMVATHSQTRTAWTAQVSGWAGSGEHVSALAMGADVSGSLQLPAPETQPAGAGCVQGGMVASLRGSLRAPLVRIGSCSLWPTPAVVSCPAVRVGLMLPLQEDAILRCGAQHTTVGCAVSSMSRTGAVLQQHACKCCCGKEQLPRTTTARLRPDAAAQLRPATAPRPTDTLMVLLLLLWLSAGRVWQPLALAPGCGPRWQRACQGGPPSRAPRGEQQLLLQLGWVLLGPQPTCDALRQACSRARSSC